MNPAFLNKLKKVQKEMKETQEKLDESIFSGSAGGGLVKVEAKGSKEIVGIKIDPEALNPEDKELLEDTIVAAINDVFNKIDSETQEVMGAFTGGLSGLL